MQSEKVGNEYSFYLLNFAQLHITINNMNRNLKEGCFSAFKFKIVLQPLILGGTIKY